MTYEEAKEIAAELTEMSTTGEDFLAGRQENATIFIEAYLDNQLRELPVDDAINYASIFALGGATKACVALQFLHEHNRLNECKHSKELIRLALETALGILSNI
jgi:hypothetical protein